MEGKEIAAEFFRGSYYIGSGVFPGVPIFLTDGFFLGAIFGGRVFPGVPVEFFWRYRQSFSGGAYRSFSGGAYRSFFGGAYRSFFGGVSFFLTDPPFGFFTL